ncbi:hypothetical protein CRENBAI_020049 [Crenichthys baileyi]|uniref:Uncharacterized protein n=1 Tax=Crenichthys baileyi TaxID=28760 RepID=A0AAV9RX85_9TELE
MGIPQKIKSRGLKLLSVRKGVLQLLDVSSLDHTFIKVALHVRQSVRGAFNNGSVTLTLRSDPFSLAVQNLFPFYYLFPSFLAQLHSDAAELLDGDVRGPAFLTKLINGGRERRNSESLPAFSSAPTCSPQPLSIQRSNL